MNPRFFVVLGATLLLLATACTGGPRSISLNLSPALPEGDMGGGVEVAVRVVDASAETAPQGPAYRRARELFPLKGDLARALEPHVMNGLLSLNFTPGGGAPADPSLTVTGKELSDRVTPGFGVADIRVTASLNARAEIGEIWKEATHTIVVKQQVPIAANPEHVSKAISEALAGALAEIFKDTALMGFLGAVG
ncbi:MAG: hypothetical protein ACE5FN_00795 [Leptospirillia bacterium]